MQNRNRERKCKYTGVKHTVTGDHLPCEDHPDRPVVAGTSTEQGLHSHLQMPLFTHLRTTNTIKEGELVAFQQSVVKLPILVTIPMRDSINLNLYRVQT